MLDLDAEYEVMSYSVGDTKAGTKMGKLQLKNKEKDNVLNCILWEEALNRLDSKIFKTGNTVKIITATYNEKYNNCLVNNLQLIKEAKAGIGQEEANEIFNDLIKTVDEFQDEKLKTFVRKTLEDNKEKLLIAPAAKVMHHNYVGGLLVHIQECVRFASAVFPLFFRKIGCEWLWRLLKEPSRFRRMFPTLPLFLFKVIIKRNYVVCNIEKR